MRAYFFRSNILFIIKHRSITFVQLVNYPVRDYPELDPKIIRRIVNMRIKGYSQLIDIVNFVVSKAIVHLLIRGLMDHILDTGIRFFNSGQ